MPLISACASRRSDAVLQSAEHPERRGRPARFWASVGTNGAQTSVLSGNLIPSGITPTIVAGCPLMRSVLPSTSGSPPYRFFQRP